MSGRKSNLTPILLQAGIVLDQNRQSLVTVINFQDNFVYQCNITGALAAGTLVPQVSQDYEEINGVVTNAGTWVDLPDMTATIAGPDTIIFDCNQLSAGAIRLDFTFTSGTGNMDVYAGAKQV